MALIKCPECKKKVSDTCETCVHCGYKFDRHKRHVRRKSSYDDEMWKDEPDRPILKAIFVILGALLAAAAIALLIYLWVTYEQRSFLKNVIMEVSAVVSLIGGGTAAILCHKLM